MRQRIKNLIYLVLSIPESVGWVEKKIGRKAFLLAFPIMIIGGLRILLRIIDFLMVSYAYESDAGLAGMTIAFHYYFIGFGLALALSSGTISVVARYLGARKPSEANFSIKQSMYLSLFLSIPLTILTWMFAESLIGLMSSDAEVVELGATYLRITMLAITFRFWSLIGARALAGAGNTETPMWIRMISVPTNVFLNWIFIFGIGPVPELGVAGAALGTVLSDLLTVLLFLWIFLSGNARVQLVLTGKQWDSRVAREIIGVAAPLGGMRLTMAIGLFPFVFIVSAAGTSLLASYGIARRVMLLALMPAWGFSTASSTLVGQHVGGNRMQEAEDSGWQTLRIALATQLLIGFILTLGADPISSLFDSRDPILTTTFIRVFGIGVAAYSISRTMQGGLRGAGDTLWPFYGTLLGTASRIGVALLALPVDVTIKIGILSFTPGFGYGVEFIYLAILVDLYIRAAVNTIRFASGTWKNTSRIRSSAADAV